MMAAYGLTGASMSLARAQRRMANTGAMAPTQAEKYSHYA